MIKALKQRNIKLPLQNYCLAKAGLKYSIVTKAVKKQQKFYSKNGGSVEAMELLLKLESVVRGDMTFESCSNDGQSGDGDNGLPV